MRIHQTSTNSGEFYKIAVSQEHKPYGIQKDWESVKEKKPRQLKVTRKLDGFWNRKEYISENEIKLMDMIWWTIVNW
jgi:hypothetical protein